MTNQIAGLHICHSLNYNFPSDREDELAEGPPKALIKGSNTLTLSLTIFWA